jgi:TIR domain/Pentapeptide repeats (8 copies)
MANPEHLAILKRGVRAWNHWREKNFRLRPDLRQVKLPGADLYKADLSWTSLYKANLTGARLVGADLSGAFLKSANLSQAYLTDANLMLANLVGTNLRGAILWRAKFETTDVSGTDFSNAKVGATIFGDVDLSVARGLDSVKHRWPSTVGINTIYRSNAKISEVFLRGAGVPDDSITYMQSLVGKPFNFYSCFISFSSKDQAFAERLQTDLQTNGVRCWFAPEDLKIGDKSRLAIDESIRVYDKLLLSLSEHSVASDWVGHEVETALAREREEKRTILFPIRLDDAVMEIKTGWPAHIKNTRHIGDFRQWKDRDSYQKSFVRLLSDLEVGEEK